MNNADKGTQARRAEEYSDERDMARFWEEAAPSREPSRWRWYIPSLVVLLILSVPWYFAEGHMGRVVGGLPVWVWITLGCTTGMASLTAWAALRHWGDDDEPDEKAPGK